MTRLHIVKKSRREFPGIPKGSTYYWWQFAYEAKQRSLTRPRRSQLTQSDFNGQLWDLEDELQDLEAGEGLQDAVANLAEQIRDLGQEQTNKRDNMPESLQDADAGTMLEERATACEEMAMELEGIDCDIPEFEADDEVTKDSEGDEPLNVDGDTEDDFTQAALDEKLGEVQVVEYQGP